jgi:hypothetical protein
MQNMMNTSTLLNTSTQTSVMRNILPPPSDISFATEREVAREREPILPPVSEDFDMTELKPDGVRIIVGVESAAHLPPIYEPKHPSA